METIAKRNFRFPLFLFLILLIVSATGCKQAANNKTEDTINSKVNELLDEGMKLK